MPYEWRELKKELAEANENITILHAKLDDAIRVAKGFRKHAEIADGERDGRANETQDGRAAQSSVCAGQNECP